MGEGEKAITETVYGASGRLSSEDQLKYLIKARYPLIYVVSPEEERVEKVLTRVANDCKSKAVWWSITKGFSQQGGADVKEPVAVRYAWAANPDCNLYNKAGLPASPFRSDAWPYQQEE